MSLNDTTLEGDYYNMSNYSARPWHGDGRAPSPKRSRVDSFIGTTVLVESMDGRRIENNLLCTLQEITDKGFLLKVNHSVGEYSEGIIIFCSTITWRSVPKDD